MSNDQLVEVSDVLPPNRPLSPTESLLDYLDGAYKKRKQELTEQITASRRLINKEDVIHLGYDALLFRMEIDPWLAFTGQLLDQQRSEQLATAQYEQRDQAKEHGQKRPDATIIKAQAEQFIAPLKRVYKELQDTQDLLSKTISWCQSQQKMLAADEYGELFSANNETPTAAQMSTPPTVRRDLENNKK